MSKSRSFSALKINGIIKAAVGVKQPSWIVPFNVLLKFLILSSNSSAPSTRTFALAINRFPSGVRINLFGRARRNIFKP